jgi:hypothetical protein
MYTAPKALPGITRQLPLHRLPSQQLYQRPARNVSGGHASRARRVAVHVPLPPLRQLHVGIAHATVSTDNRLHRRAHSRAALFA